MKTHMTIQELGSELKRQDAAKEDYIAPFSSLSMEDDATVRIRKRSYNPTNLGHEQLCSRLGIGSRYYNRMLENCPDLLADNVNYWLQQAEEDVTLRCLDNRLRAVLSSSYRRIDHLDVAQRLLPAVKDHNLTIRSAHVDIDRMYLKATTPKIVGKKKGDAVSLGISIYNNEVGQGHVIVQPFCEVLACTNGMTIARDLGGSVRKRHRGKRRYAEGEIQSLDTNGSSDDEDLWTRLQENLENALEAGRNIPQGIERARAFTLDPENWEAISGSLRRAFLIPVSILEDVRDNWIASRRPDMWGLVNAITAQGNREDISYRDASRFESIGGEIFSMSEKEWERLHSN